MSAGSACQPIPLFFQEQVPSEKIEWSVGVKEKSISEKVLYFHLSFFKMILTPTLTKKVDSG